MKQWLSAALLGAILGIQAQPSMAGPNLNAKIVPHVLSTTTKNQCARPEARPSCSGVVPQGSLYPTLYYTYILVMDGSGAAGVRGLQLGIDYDGVLGAGIDVFSWTRCATLEFASAGWPGANTGNLITWSGCENVEPGGAGTGVTAVAGYLYMAAYTPDVLRIRPRPVDGLAKVADCNAIEDILLAGTPPNSSLGEAAFSAGATAQGFNPCGLEVGVTCLISGPASVETGSIGNVYSVSSSPSGATFNWSITGNGTIVGPVNGSSVSVTAGAPGPLALRVDVVHGGQPNFCTQNVTVVPGPPMATCSIAGSAPVLAGSSGHVYSVTSPNMSPSFVWSISGDGTIVGPTTGSTVTVDAGNTGAFMLDVDVTAGSLTGHCSKLVNVDALTCGITGPDPVYNLATLTYSSTAPVGTVFLWSVTGNATINGAANGSSVVVDTGAPGTFNLHLVVSSSTGSLNCDKSVTVVPRPGPGPGANVNARIALHVMSITSKNACGTRALVPCQSIVTNGGLYPGNFYFTYVLVTDGYAPAGITGVQLGILYNGTEGSGIDVFGWTLCATNEQRSTGWPASGGGNLLTWSTCQNTEPGGAGTGVVAVGGYFYMGAYTPDAMRITKRPSDNLAVVLDCNGLPSTIADRLPPPFGVATFGSIAGYNPCGGLIVPAQPTTWSAIKSMYPR